MRCGLTLVITLLAGCASSLPHPAPKPQPQSVRSLTGEELQPIAIPVDREARLRSDLDTAIAAFNTSQSEDNFIWLGRRYAYLGDYTTAISTFSRGLAKYPQSYKLLRHRGHRYITTRQLDLAITDLSRQTPRFDIYSHPTLDINEALQTLKLHNKRREEMVTKEMEERRYVFLSVSTKPGFISLHVICASFPVSKYVL